MCGIGGVIKFTDKQTGIISLALNMSLTLKHRGPDDSGCLLLESGKETTAFFDDTPEEVINSRVPYKPDVELSGINTEPRGFLVHRRLSILDLSPAGHQPMCNSDRSLWITYNGEIYNYPEIREELKEKGYHFTTRTDTEVVLNAYHCWGSSCLNHFNGMWSFVIYDREKQKFFAARDRFGVKPFYYFRSKDYFAFASEQKALVSLPFYQKSINHDAVFDYFVKGEIELEQESFFNGIMELMPSHFLELDLRFGELKISRYYALPILEEGKKFDASAFKISADHTRRLLSDAVKLRLRSDVPVGSCLSGGIDSSALVMLMDKEMGGANPIHLFTAVFNDHGIDEKPFAAAIVEQVNGIWHQVKPEATDLKEELEQLIFSQDIPIWSTSTYAQFRVMKAAHENGIKVVLDGQGADELFGGYHTYFYYYWNELFRRFRWSDMQREMRHFLPFPHHLLFYMKQHLRFRSVPALPASLQLYLNRNYHGDLFFLNPLFLQQNRHRISNGRTQTKHLNQALFHEFTHSRLKGYLKTEDRCSMWHSVESRVPFADDLPLIQYVFSQPSGYKIRNGYSKYLLRQSVKDLLPGQVLNRRDKLGFATPNSRWIRELKDVWESYLTPDLAEFYDMDKFRLYFSDLFEGNKGPDDVRSFKFFAFAVWKKVFKM